METLKYLLEKLKASPSIASLFNEIIISNEDNGRDEIIPGNDTFIYLGENGKFVFEDMHNNDPSFEATADEMVDYYEGTVDGYDIHIREKSPFYQKGFIQTAKGVFKLGPITEKEKQLKK